jgi:ubiquinone/menaquinone biosynthesis C-methylase UbiE
MSDVVEERVSRYILDGADEDLRRLLSISQLTAGMARGAFRRVGVQEGWNAIDCGCGPIGALAVMAEMVGVAGRVVGVDFSQPAVERARGVVSALGLDNVEVVEGDIHELDPTTLGAPFDVAYTRLFLMHQADLPATLRQIGALLRPGGWLVAQEPLRNPPPRSQPHLAALDEYWALMHELMERGGAAHNAIEDLPRSAREAGLEVVGVDGLFNASDSELGFEIQASTVAAMRERAANSDIPMERVDGLIQDLRAAKEGGYLWVSSPFFLELTLRKPAVA